MIRHSRLKAGDPCWVILRVVTGGWSVEEGRLSSGSVRRGGVVVLPEYHDSRHMFYRIFRTREEAEREVAMRELGR